MRNIIPNLADSEKRVLETYIGSLDIKPRTTAGSICIATVGLVGSGKTTFCEIASRELPATHVSYAGVKVLLWKSDQPFNADSYRNISLHAVVHVIKNGGNVAVDNDNIEPEKRKYLYDIMKAVGGVPVFVHLNPSIDVIISRIIENTYNAKSIFSNAVCSYDGEYQIRAVTTRIRTFFERLPHHFTWNDRSCRYEPKAIDRILTLSVDTGSPRSETAISTLVKHIRLQHQH